MSFGVRVLFNVGNALHSDQSEITLDLSGTRAILKPEHEGKFEDSTSLVLLSSGFTDRDAAVSFGSRAKEAILLASFDARIGVDLGNNKAKLSVSQCIKDEIYHKHGVIIHDAIHGVYVYNDDVEARFFSMRGEGRVLHSSEKFCRFLESRFSENNIPDEGLSHAIEILTHAYMEKSSLSQFVLAIAAIEAVSKRGNRPPEERLLLDQAIAFLKGTDAIPAEKERVISLIGSMKKESVGAACRREIEQNVSWEDSEIFKLIYAKRSGILHGGAQGDQYEVAGFADKVMDIAHRLISSLAQKANEL